MDPRNSAPNNFFAQSRGLGLPVQKARRILGRVIGAGDFEPSSWTEKCIISKEEQALFPPVPRLIQTHIATSAIDNFQKIVFRTPDGLSIETVIIPLEKDNSVTICLSSQVGCVMACDFCATGRMKQRRNLETWEIIDQFIQARDLVSKQGRTITGAVFMGMGEPFLNYSSVIAAAELLSFPVLNAISAKAITISTVGLVDKIDRFTNEEHPFRLSISLGSAIDSKRAVIVPVAAKTPVKEVMAAARKHALKKNDRINLAYVCISRFNVLEEDAIALGELIADTPVRLDLIEVTDPTGKYKRPSEAEMKSFRDALRKFVKQPVVRRYSGGVDIQAACGTLAGQG